MTTITMSARYALEAQAFQAGPKRSVNFCQGFHVGPCGAGGILISATDGKTAVIFRDESGIIDGPPVIIRLTKPILAQIKLATKKSGALLKIETLGKSNLLDTSNASIEILVEGVFSDTKTTAPIIVDVPPEKIPDYIGVFPTETTEATSYEAGHLTAFLDLAGEDKPGERPLTIVSTGPGSPKRVHIPGRDDFVGVILPMRGTDLNVAYPGWLRR